jgi:Fic family protein
MNETSGHAGSKPAWPPHAREQRPWRQSVRAGRREDRMLKHVEVSIPPPIAELSPAIDAGVLVAVERCAVDVVDLDRSAGHQLGALGSFLIRSDSVASSKIEHINADPIAFAKAAGGFKANKRAQEIFSAVKAMTYLIERSSQGKLELEGILCAHHSLMCDDVIESAYAGRLRDMQNWIGGSDYSPRNALYVPPPPELVPGLMEDLVLFANRDDVPAIAQAAIVHAQFESIHPFTDGNGRIGRALINAVLRRRHLTTTTIVPIAAAMLANVERYFRELSRYQEGDATSLVRYIADLTRWTAQETRASAEELVHVRERWEAAVQPRSGSADAALLDRILDSPVLDAHTVAQLTGVHIDTAYATLGRLTGAGVLEEITGGKRNRLWVAHDVIDELERLMERFGPRAEPSHLSSLPR